MSAAKIAGAIDATLKLESGAQHAAESSSTPVTISAPSACENPLQTPEAKLAMPTTTDTIKPTIAETPLRVLALDGGGMRGVITLTILKEFERVAQKKVCSVFAFDG